MTDITAKSLYVHETEDKIPSLISEHICTRQIKSYKMEGMKSVICALNFPAKVLHFLPNLVDFFDY